MIALLFLFHAACGSEYELHTGGWSAVMGVRKQCLKQGGCLSRCSYRQSDDNFQMKPSLLPVDPILGEEQRCWRPLPKLHFLLCDRYNQQSDKPPSPLSSLPSFSTPFSWIRCQVLPFSSWGQCEQDTLFFLPKVSSLREWIEHLWQEMKVEYGFVFMCWDFSDFSETYAADQIYIF